MKQDQPTALLLPVAALIAGMVSLQCGATFAKTLLTFRQKDAPELERAGLTPTEVGGLLRIVSQMRDLPYGQPVLCDGDLGADHLFVGDDLELTGVIDFGMAQGGAPALDVGVLRMFHPEIELAWLAEGYGGGPFTAEGFEREVLAQQVDVAMSYLAENLRRGTRATRTSPPGGCGRGSGGGANLEARPNDPVRQRLRLRQANARRSVCGS